MGSVSDKLAEYPAGAKKRYWLFKSEPDVYGIDHLMAEKDQTTTWDGIRNYRARNLLRDDVKKGDEVLFYHSNAKPPGIVGLCTVVKDGYPDHTALNPKEKYFDPKATKEKNPWYMVDVKFKRKFKRMISLEELKNTPELSDMLVVMRGMRLSTQPVSPDEFKFILELAKKKGPE